MPTPGYWTLLALVIATAPVAAQEWRAGAEIPLVRAAAEARGARDRTAAVAGWQAEAHGIVRFMAVVDHEGSPVERVMRVDELRVEVYGEAPSRSKQRIVAWRDTLLQPTTIRYHRDHLGIVANDFGPLIRLGQGEEVRDVPHPLSAAGLQAYAFRIGDTLRIVSGADTLRVVTVDVRPLDPAGAGLIGTLYLDRDRAALVRLRFTFTPASYRDPTVERITVVLENSLHERERWLPHHQSIAIDRASPWIVLPITTRIIAEWEIDGYRLGVEHPAGRFAGAPVAGLQAPGGEAWRDPLPVEGLAAVPSVELATEELTHELVGRRLDGLPLVRLAGSGGVSSLLRVNRVEGLAFGTGLRWTPDDRTSLEGDIGGATVVGRLTGGIRLVRPVGGITWELSASRRVVDVADDLAGSLLANSVATAIAGRDSRDWFGRDRARLEARLARPGIRYRLGIALENTTPEVAGFTALDGSQRANPDLGIGSEVVASSEVSMGDAERAGGRLRLEGAETWRRASLHLGLRVGGRVAATFDAGLGSAMLPAHRAFVLGGRGSLVGHPNRNWWGRRMIRVELALPFDVHLPAPSLPGLPLGGELRSRLVPYLAVGRVGGEVVAAPRGPSDGLEASLGLRLDLWGPLMRITLGWAPGPGRVGVTFDAHPDWWPLL